MPIEFHCQKCHNLLRTPDDTAGQPAKCPQCGEITQVPSPDTDEISLAPEAPRGPLGPKQPANIPPEHRPESGTGVPPVDTGETPVPHFGPPADPDNPFASPGYTGEAGDAGAQQPSTGEGGRNGPPWERDGASPASFIATVKEIFSGPSLTFRHVRRTGGIGAPLWYGVIGGTLGGWIGMLYQLVVNLVTAPAPRQQFGGNQPEWVDFMQGGGANIFGSVCGAILLPLFMVIGLFISAGITHLVLMMLSGDRHGFEATFRAIAYTNGTTSLLQFIPMCGPYIAMVTQIVFAILALMGMHDISGGKATAVVLLPAVVCCACGIGLIFFFVFAAFSAFS